jgi:hypothetical protein
VAVAMIRIGIEIATVTTSCPVEMARSRATPVPTAPSTRRPIRQRQDIGSGYGPAAHAVALTDAHCSTTSCRSDKGETGRPHYHCAEAALADGAHPHICSKANADWVPGAGMLLPRRL